MHAGHYKHHGQQHKPPMAVMLVVVYPTLMHAELPSLLFSSLITLVCFLGFYLLFFLGFLQLVEEFVTCEGPGLASGTVVGVCNRAAVDSLSVPVSTRLSASGNIADFSPIAHQSIQTS